MGDDSQKRRRRRRLGQALDSEVRLAILRQLIGGGTIAAAEVKAPSKDLSLSCAAYHLRVLEESGAVEVADTQHERGRVIRNYRITKAGKGLLS